MQFCSGPRQMIRSKPTIRSPSEAPHRCKLYSIAKLLSFSLPAKHTRGRHLEGLGCGGGCLASASRANSICELTHSLAPRLRHAQVPVVVTQKLPRCTEAPFYELSLLRVTARNRKRERERESEIAKETPEDTGEDERRQRLDDISWP